MGASKKVAAACFLEILQLKTWNYVNVVQANPFNDIVITGTDKLFAQQTYQGDISQLSHQVSQ